jgi:transcriptional regulator with XRE-family HTH domain
MSPTGSDIGKRIKKFREKRSMSITQLSKISGISKSYISNLENGEHASRPSGNTLYRIAKALDVTMSELLGRKLLFEPTTRIPAGLKQFAEEEGLSETEVQMLASIRFRGDQPQSRQRWEYIYRAISTSATKGDLRVISADPLFA